MRRMCALALMPLALLLGAAPGDDSAKDLRVMQGSWALAEIAGGAMKPDEELKSMTITIRGNKVTMLIKGEEKGTGTFTLDASKTPRRMDLTLMKGDAKMTVKAIYEVSREGLKVCHFDGEKEGYPEKFEATKDTILATFKRG